MPPNKPTQAIESANLWARFDIRSGFVQRDQALADTVERLTSDGYTGDAPSTAAAIVDREIAELQRDQTTWPEVTDCDRLDNAFEELNRRGILARHHYAPDGPIGGTDALAEINDIRSKGGTARGYCFYHWQGTESAVDGYGLGLWYGNGGSVAECVAIGEEVREVLEQAGLKVDWDGTINKVIMIDLEWQRPWPPRAPDILPDHLMPKGK